MNLFQRLFGRQTTPASSAPASGSGPAAPQPPEQLLDSADPAERLGTIIALADAGRPEHYALVKRCIEIHPDQGVRFAALKRIHSFEGHPDLLPFLQNLQAANNTRHLEPYLSMALHRAGLITPEEFEARISGK